MSGPSNVKPTLFALSWPIFVEQGLRALIATVDTFMVSHVGDDAVAGLAVSSQVVTFFLIIFAFVGIGSSVVITHHIGAHDKDGARRIASTAIAANVWLGVLCSGLVFLFAEKMLHLMQLPQALFVHALPFLVLMGGSLFLESMNVSISAVLRAHAHAKDAMFVTAGQNVINVAGNCLLLFGLFGCPKLGVLGVACSSVFSRLAACLALWLILKKRTGISLGLADFFSLRIADLKRILHIGLPAAGENICWWVAFMVVTSMAASMGGTVLATQSYTMSVVRWVIILNISIGLGTEIIIGRLVGAGALEEAYHELLASLKFGFLVAALASVLVAATAHWLMALFTKDPAIIACGVMLLRMGLLLEPGRVFNLVVINSLRATGDARFPVFMGLLSMWGVWVPLTWFLGVHLGWGLTGFWIAMIADEWLRGVMMYRRWTKRNWQVHAERSRAQIRSLAAEG